MARIFLTTILSATMITVLAVVPVGAQSGNYRHDLTIFDDGKDKRFSGPEGVDCRGDRLVVADSKNSRVLFYTTLRGVANLTGEVKLTRQVWPTIAQFTADGGVLVYDSKAKDILVFGPDGQPGGKIQPRNVPGGSRVITKSFRVDREDGIYLLDVFGRRVVVLDQTGAFRKQITFPPDFGFISDLAVDGNGRVYVLDSLRSQVLAAGPEADTFTPLSGILKEVLTYPTHLEVDSNGLLYVVDEDTSTVGMLRRDGSFQVSLFNRGRKEGLLYYPSQICVGDGSRIVIADRDNNRVQVFVEKE